MIGSMAAVPLAFEPPDAPSPGAALYEDPVHVGLQRHGIQASVGTWPQRPAGESWRRVLRFSAAPYVSVQDLELLARVLPDLVPTSARLG